MFECVHGIILHLMFYVIPPPLTSLCLSSCWWSCCGFAPPPPIVSGRSYCTVAHMATLMPHATLHQWKMLQFLLVLTWFCQVLSKHCLVVPLAKHMQQATMTAAAFVRCHIQVTSNSSSKCKKQQCYHGTAWQQQNTLVSNSTVIMMATGKIQSNNHRTMGNQLGGSDTFLKIDPHASGVHKNKNKHSTWQCKQAKQLTWLMLPGANKSKQKFLCSKLAEVVWHACFLVQNHCSMQNLRGLKRMSPEP